MNVGKNSSKEESAMKSKNGRTYNVFCENDALERKEIISLLAQRIAQLPEPQKQVLAMYYYENRQLSKIAAISGTTESQICQIRAQAVAVLGKYLTELLA